MIIDENSTIPKYKQIVQAVISDVEQGRLVKGDLLLSINEFSEEHYLSRDTVEKAYRDLREKGIIISVRGKGYFVNSLQTDKGFRIFLHFNKLSTYKKTIYDAFVATIGNCGTVDIFIHHNSMPLFENQLIGNLGNYSHYVIIPPDTKDQDLVIKLLKKVPTSKLLLLDKLVEGFDSICAVYQNFETDIYQALAGGMDLLGRYRKLSLIFPKTKGYAAEVMIGFTKFCNDSNFEFEIISEVQENKVNAGKAFIVIEEEDLVGLLKIIKSRKLQLGLDVGILSYNETPLKEILADGITVISTDFYKMGQSAAEMILSHTKSMLQNDFKLIVRNSL